MKRNLLSIVALLALISISYSCKKTIVSNNDIRDITGSIKDISSEEGVGEYIYNLDDIYKIKDEPNVLPENEVYNNSNPVLLSAEIIDRVLYVRINAGQTGSGQVTIRSRSGSVYRDDTFKITITAISAAEAMTRAVNYFKAGDYVLSESHFELVIAKNASASLSDAYMGLGFSRMRLGKEEDSYGYNDLKTSRGLNPSNVDAIAGLSLLDYAINEDYTKAISYGRETLNKAGEFVFRYDEKLDKNDILLNIALSQYAAQLFDDCLATIQQLDATYTADTSAGDFKTQLFEKLQELVDMYK